MYMLSTFVNLIGLKIKISLNNILLVIKPNLIYIFTLIPINCPFLSISILGNLLGHNLITQLL